MTFRLGAGSQLRLRGVDDRLVRVVHRAIELTTQDFSVIDGLRTPDQQFRHLASGASKNANSPHLYGRAVDLQPYLGPGVDPYPRKGDTYAQIREKLARFEAVASAMFEAADELRVPLQWGNDWDCDGIPTGQDKDERGQIQDYPHFQLPAPHREPDAFACRERRIEARARGEGVIS